MTLRYKSGEEVQVGDIWYSTNSSPSNTFIVDHIIDSMTFYFRSIETPSWHGTVSEPSISSYYVLIRRAKGPKTKSGFAKWIVMVEND